MAAEKAEPAGPRAKSVAAGSSAVLWDRLTDPDGAAAVRLARRTLALGLSRPAPSDPVELVREVPVPPSFDALRGVFVTLLESPAGTLRGCIGFPTPRLRLREGIPRAAWAAAVEDPRFPALSYGELGGTVIEVSVLTAPELLPRGNSREIPGRIEIGRDGLLVESPFGSGILLSQVPVEQGWGPEEFLAETCLKAGLGPEAWTEPTTRLLRFESEIFRELEPSGRVDRRRL